MLIFKRSADITEYLTSQRITTQSSAFVPTMGALHMGHISLINKAKSEANLVIVSIFVNPTQFNDPEDFKKYPITLEQDIYLLEKAGCDVLFLPAAVEMYPAGVEPLRYDIGYLETILEGASRPGHFQGVCQIVDKLLRIVAPDKLVMGQKDYQQCMVVQRLLELTNSSVKLVLGETLREEDGLAMSSRNMRLSNTEKALSVGIFKTLRTIEASITPGDLTMLISKATQQLIDYELVPDYVVIANANTLEPVTVWDGNTKLVALVAAYMGKVRLIDNLILPLNFAGCK